jgi:hypothetical protein
VVLPLPALLNVAVSPLPGGPPRVQLRRFAQVELIVPSQVALAAGAEGVTSLSACARAPEFVGAIAVADESEVPVAVALLMIVPPVPALANFDLPAPDEWLAIRRARTPFLFPVPAAEPLFVPVA